MNRFTLENGLRVVHDYDPDTAMVAVDVLYNVGARDEEENITGLAHLFEHLMFGGSVNIPDFDAEMERAGGTNNAWTSNDFTNFYDYAPAANIDTLLWLESDRMLSLAFSERSLEVQRSVVIEEFKQTHLNKPYGDVAHRLRELLYTTHPYRYPTIGIEPSHIERVTLEDVKRFFYSHYAPNNAVLSICGNITAEEVKEKVEYWFGDIPRRDIAPRLYSAEPPVTSPRELTVHARCPQPLVITAYHMPAYGEPGYVECDLITDMLASGRSSRYYRDLVMGDPLFTEADASISGSEEAGFLMLRGRLSEGSDEAVRTAVERLNTEARKLCHTACEAFPEGVNREELARAVNRFDSNSQFATLSCVHRAQENALAEMRGEDIDSRLAAYRAVTPEAIATTASDVLSPQGACTLLYLPE